MLSGRAATRRRTWEAAEKFLSRAEFGVMLRRQFPFNALLGCSEWRLAKPCSFHGKDGDRSLQVVEIERHMENDGAAADTLTKKKFVFTFCLRKVQEGAFKDCWMVVGLRSGDYTL